MATVNQLKEQTKQQPQNTHVSIIKALLNNPNIKQKFDDMLSKRAPQYMSSIINLVNNDEHLQKCDPMTVIGSCLVAATMDLPIDKNLGYAWVVPYGGKAQFQIGYKGYIQLAHRSGAYKAINVLEVHEDELVKWNKLSEELEIDLECKASDKVIGYAGYFKLVNGFEKTVYWTKEEIEDHRKKFSKSDFGWNKDYDAMAKKTVLRNMLNKWGILSIEMQTAYVADMSTQDKSYIESGQITPNAMDGNDYSMDNTVVDADYNEVTEDAQIEDTNNE